MIRLKNAVTAAITLVTAAVAAWRFWPVNALARIPEEHLPRVISNWRDYSLLSAQAPETAAVVHVVVFSDYLCPHCRTAFSTMRRLGQDNPSRVRIVWRHFPVLGGESMSAALAAICAEQAGRFARMHEHLFAESDSVGRKPWTRFALDAGVTDTSGFAECLVRDGTLAVLRHDLTDAQELAVQATPSVLLDSLLFQGVPTRAYLQAYIRNAIPSSR